MTLEAIVIPLRLKQKKKIFPPGQACMHCVPWGLIFMFDGRRIRGYAAVTG